MSTYKFMPLSNPNFVGCEDYLQEIEDCFFQKSVNGTSHRIYVLFGVGGVGKTQISLRFVETSSNR